MPTSLHSIEANNLSYAWAQAFLALMRPGISSYSPLIISFSPADDSAIIESSTVRAAVDQALADAGEQSIHTVANTIFPKTLWKRELGKDQLFARFARVQDYVLRDPLNVNGHYFQRLVAFEAHRGSSQGVNQLEHVISTYHRGNHRLSALQASIFDPTRDHTNSYRRGFPCLQHVQFVPDTKAAELTIVGVYANQYIFEKAYGNLLGLRNLGCFMAHEMGLRLQTVMCVVSRAKLGAHTKTKLRPLETILREELEQQ